MLIESYCECYHKICPGGILSLEFNSSFLSLTQGLAIAACTRDHGYLVFFGFSDSCLVAPQ